MDMSTHLIVVLQDTLTSVIDTAEKKDDKKKKKKGMGMRNMYRCGTKNGYTKRKY